MKYHSHNGEHPVCEEEIQTLSTHEKDVGLILGQYQEDVAMILW